MAITHAKVDASDDNPNLLPANKWVYPSDWNASHVITLDSYTDGSSKFVKNGNNWEIWTNGTRVAFIDSSGNLHIKGVIITEDGSV